MALVTGEWQAVVNMDESVPIETGEQRTIIQQYADWYTCR